MVLVNKTVLNAVPLPLTFLWIQLVVAVLILWMGSALRIVRLPVVTADTCRAISPLIFVNVIGLTLNTICLQYVDASFFQIARSLVLPFTVLFTFIGMRQNVSTPTLTACAIVFFGFIVGSFMEKTEVHISSYGILIGVLSSVTTAAHAIIIKLNLEVVRGSTMDLVYLNNLLSAAVLAPLLVISGETKYLRMLWQSPMGIDRMTDANPSYSSDENRLLTLIAGGVASGLFGFLINIAGIFQIKVTSPLSHMISSAFRGLTDHTCLCCVSEVITTTRLTSIGVVLFGSTLYAFVKGRRAQEAIIILFHHILSVTIFAVFHFHYVYRKGESRRGQIN
ncbi:hypothetical protein BC829DRAFT_363340 [Chytridium lagenaria]|nr:hypothetical protein BC829DRAFT_363340 [Chytridium lagenaria]